VERGAEVRAWNQGKRDGKDLKDFKDLRDLKDGGEK
jgi:hypothetical protein